MSKDNYTSVNEFLLLGFPQIKGFKTIISFVLIMTVYIITLAINSMIITLVSTRPQLHSPMYYFLQQLSCSENVFLTVIIPNMLRVIWLEGATMSIVGCITQTYLYCALGCTECNLLTVMSYDRYLAICNPLRYSTIMTIKLQHSLVIYCWLYGFVIHQITLYFLCQLQFCRPNVIDHFFCDLDPFIELSCSNTDAVQLEVFIVAFSVLVIPFILVVISYICVFTTIIGISSKTGKMKAFSTCSSHLSVVTMYYGTLITIYIVPADGRSLTMNKLIALLYTVVTPLFNPIIYSLRNQEIRVIMENIFRSKWPFSKTKHKHEN
ncbi:olfactory receptor 6B1-like [Pseudophryne corroboree]|uniref:olfactory receptor 6B1-like n=1 Tax=Pseudophryne corroboree TaxID=495146 RepID=UPI003081A488